jgi:pimeloyl-ACP methyl ester carboxylesterase
MLERLMTIGGQRQELLLRGELSRLAAPTLFAWGDREPFAPPSSGQDASRTMKDARVEVVKRLALGSRP